jgi:hypothetical protein
MKFGTDAGYKGLSSEHEIHENRLRDTNTLGINESLVYFPHLLSELVQIRRGRPEPKAFGLESLIKTGEGKAVAPSWATKQIKLKLAPCKCTL